MQQNSQDRQTPGTQLFLLSASYDADLVLVSQALANEVTVRLESSKAIMVSREAAQLGFAVERTRWRE